MKIRFFVETNWPSDREREPLLDGLEWTQTCEMPLVPRIGDMVAVHEDDDFREVEQVFFTVGKREISVHFKFDDAVCRAKHMAKTGWVEA